MKLDGVPNAKSGRTEILKGEGKRFQMRVFLQELVCDGSGEVY